MAEFPTDIYTHRATANLPGISYDVDNTTNLYSEDIQNLGGEITAIETALGADLENVLPSDLQSLGDFINALSDPDDGLSVDSAFLLADDTAGFEARRVTWQSILDTLSEIFKTIVPTVTQATSYTTNTGSSLLSYVPYFIVTAQAGPLKFNNPSGTKGQGSKIIIRIKDNGTARALTYDTQYRGISQTLPSTTVVSKTLYMGFIYNSTDTKWDLVAVAQES